MIIDEERNAGIPGQAPKPSSDGLQVFVGQRLGAQLQRSERFLRQVTSVLAEGLMVLDRDAKLFFLNPEAERLLGWSKEDLADHDVHHEIHQHESQDLPAEQCRIRRALRRGTVERVDDEMFFRRDGRGFAVAYTAAPMLEDGGIDGVVVAFQDISSRKRLED